VQTIKFVGVVVCEKKRFKTIVDGNAYAYERPWDKDRRRNSSVLKIGMISLILEKTICLL
jgi:hypothetical protein